LGECSALKFPPASIVSVDQGVSTIKTFLLAHHNALKIMMTILAARRRHMRHPPPELWVLIRDEFFSGLTITLGI